MALAQNKLLKGFPTARPPLKHAVIASECTPSFPNFLCLQAGLPTPIFESWILHVHAMHGAYMHAVGS